MNEQCRADCHTGEPWRGPRPALGDIYACTYPLGHGGDHEPPYFQRRGDWRHDAEVAARVQKIKETS